MSIASWLAPFSVFVVAWVCGCWLARKHEHIPRLTAMRRLQALWDAEQEARLS